MLDLLYRQSWEIQLWASSKKVVTTFITMNRQKLGKSQKVQTSDYTIVLWLLHRFKIVLQSLINI